MSDVPNNILDVIQECVDHLEAIPFFNDITILHEDDADLANKIKTGLGVLNSKDGRAGALVLFVTAQARTDQGQLAAIFDPVKLAVRVLEHPKVNRDPNSGTGKSALLISQQIQLAFNGSFKPLSANSPLKGIDPGMIPANDPKHPGFDNFFQTSVTSTAEAMPQVATPVVIYSGTTVQITCDTPGAAIFWSVDRRKPSPRNATFYNGTFTAEDPTAIYARAWLPGYLASEVTRPIEGEIELPPNYLLAPDGNPLILP